jgi:hypothetical protein
MRVVGRLGEAEDFIGTEKYGLADGSTVESRTFIIKSLKVGDRTVTDVRASITDVNGPLLLGQSFLKRFKSWSQDNAAHELILVGPEDCKENPDYLAFCTPSNAASTQSTTLQQQPSCFGSEDCKNHPDYLPFGTSEARAPVRRSVHTNQ